MIGPTDMRAPGSRAQTDGETGRYFSSSNVPVGAGATDIQGSHRLEAELRFAGMVGWLWLVGLLHAVTWIWAVGLLSTQQLRDIPWLDVVVPQVLAFGAVGVSLLRELPWVRWPSASAGRRRTIWLALLGWPALPFAIVLAVRHRRIPHDAMATPEQIERAFLRLLELPRLCALRFVGWGALAYLVDAVLLGLHAGWDQDVVIAIAVLWVGILGPLAATVHGWGRAILRPEYLSAPRTAPIPFRRTGELRPRLVVAAGAACVGAIAAPLAAGYLWIRGIDPAAMLPLRLLLVCAALCMVFALGAIVLIVVDVHRDVTRAAAQVAAVADGRAPPPLTRGSFSSHEIRQLVQAVDALVQRITEANVAKYVAIERAKEADRLKSQFLANMSHDLRSPLNSVIGFSELLLTGIEGELAPGQRELVEPIHVGGRHLLQQIDDILDTAKLEASRLELHPEPTPPAALVSRAIQSARARRPHVEWATDIAAGLPVVFCDPYRTTQALENVLAFAAERCHDERVQIAVRPGRSVGRRVVFVRVATPKKPATAEQLAQARRGFTRIPGHRGLGLGLPLAGAILELSGGSLSIEELGDGMVFTLELPAPEARRKRLKTDPNQ
jgi:signal transduction histidine kinase